ncbi:hypothetical protein F5J12DRAFT_849765 [Pisolithus orientalis]|uniref:uncharacterized protein n=1 Tax=Pisolithus orientalis TaxID=936130 RepID=UPI0022246BBF|nr:uncharacterized protein F5J12DRAFT_849765 [Pisolithus orientalis]KAI5998341.1 hypothetical protein F5J12DRAFT_849765 [Pisolithus orientalis]
MNLKWYKSFLCLMCVLNHLKCAASDSITVVPFGHPALVQLILNLLWGEKQYLVIALAGMAFRMFLALEFSLKDNHAIHQSITRHIMNLQGTELLDYTMLVNDLIAQGKEMIEAP